jgi:methylenetetrahydrofolate dehydrogenase (NADP+)/methenyltetrahydrofolate cyclohydrolase
MQAKIIDGNAQALLLRQSLIKEVQNLELHGIIPKLAVVLVGNNTASSTYVKIKTKKAEEIGIATELYKYDTSITTEELKVVLQKLNTTSKVHGILVQMPLPKHIDSKIILQTIAPAKDVDGFSPINVGNLHTNSPLFTPCTPLGVMHLIKSVCPDISGLNAVVIGRSNIVGRPVAELLLQENCTVTILHSQSKNIAEHCITGDILIAAVGIPNMVKKTWIKPGAIVIDVGINKIQTYNGETKIVGDIDFDDVVETVSYITPVPGGVGPMTVAYMLANTVRAAFTLHT